MKPYVVCHMMTSADGRILPRRWTKSPDGTRDDWTATYGAIHEGLEAGAWIVGRVTMAEMSHVAPHPPANAPEPPQPHHFARKGAKAYAIALDPSGKLHFDRAEIDGDPIVVLIGREAPAAHLAELVADGVSYVVSEGDQIDLADMLETLSRELGITRLALEGGGGINGAFFAAGLVDELSLLIAPTLDGQTGSRALVEIEGVGLAGKVELSLLACERLDHGLARLRYAVRAV
jgi:riboflavin biosynthesis pyrimidine reductase